MHLQSAGWAVGPADSLGGSCHRLKVTRCIYTLSTDTEGGGTTELKGLRKSGSSFSL